MKVKTKGIINSLGVAAFLLMFVAGCTVKGQGLQDKYSVKQVQGKNSEATYVICKECIEYTNINKTSRRK